MPRCATQEEFISKAVSVAKPHYDLSNATYVTAKTKIEVVCTKEGHGPFFITPNNFLSGKGCAICAKEDKGVAEKELHGKLFFLRAYEAHKSTYIYDKTVYNGAHELVTVTCRKHGDFLISPNNHIRGKGCRECAYEQNGLGSRLTYEDFLETSSKVNPLYSPCDRTKFTSREGRVWMNCKLHGDFNSRACTIMKGAGCGGCANYGYNPNSPGTFYVLVSDNLSKIGITNRKPEKRLKSVRKSSGKEFRVKSAWNFDNGVTPLSLETALLRELRSKYKQPTEKFDGSTECFYDVDQEWLLSRIEELIKEQYATN